MKTSTDGFKGDIPTIASALFDVIKENIIENNTNLKNGLAELNKLLGFEIPFEAWSAIQNEDYIKKLFKV